MSYRLTLYASEEVADHERQAAGQRFRQALDASLGDAGLVIPVYNAYRHIVAIYGDAPAPDTLSDAEQQVFDQWQVAESAAMTAAFGPHRYMGDAYFEITP
ncbi:hypothetical protein BH10PSE16_BH10PSE16_40220 [soil metagenome]